MASDSSYNDTIVFDESEVEPITSNGPGYSGVVVFDDSEVEPITAGQPTYQDVIVFDDTEAEHITGRAPSLPPIEVIAFDESNVESVVGLPTGGPYQQVIEFDESAGLVVTGRPAPRRSGSGYVGALGAPTSRAAEQPRPVRTTGPDDRPAWWPQATGISFELADAWLLPPPADIQTEMILPQTQVLSWLRKHRREIADAESKWRVDRRAIAAAIAWEALANVRTVSIRASGPGKVHTNAEVVQEVEKAGYLPPQSSNVRRELLKRPEVAITYIAAIMSAKAAVAETFGFAIRTRVDILANEYQGRSLREWTDHLVNKHDTTLVGGNPMSSWATRHLRYLELGVGAPGSSLPPEQ